MAASYFSRLIPAFPGYSGPYKVGTVDVEIAVDELESPSPTPEGVEIETVQFRIFYPAQSDSRGEAITWLPEPQRSHLAAYIKFLGARGLVAEAASFLPRHLHFTRIPAIKNAPVLTPNTSNKRWPVAIFSHGLGGNRNAYSHIVGSLASHGVVVICPEHRDGSAAATFVRVPTQQIGFFSREIRRQIPFKKMPHDPTEEFYKARNEQFCIRLWELGLIHNAILQIDAGPTFHNLERCTGPLVGFADRLNVHEPGSIIFAGHSFGAATMVQFLKSIYYAGSTEVATLEEPLYTPSRDSELCRQVTSRNPTILLDMWCTPLFAKTTRPLFDLPLPVYADEASAVGGRGLLAIESETFFEWKVHLHATARVLSPKPSVVVVDPKAYERPSGMKLSEPYVFYVQQSAHLNQSDFGILFPWLTKRVFKAQEPERALRLNVRALLQFLRVNDVPVARTWHGDLVDGADVDKIGAERPCSSASNKSVDDGIHQDKVILERSGTSAVEAWRWIDIIGLGYLMPDLDHPMALTNEAEGQKLDVAEELEPHVPEGQAVTTVVNVSA